MNTYLRFLQVAICQLALLECRRLLLVRRVTSYLSLSLQGYLAHDKQPLP